MQADEEPVDTMPEIREAVKPKCAADFKDYEVRPCALLALDICCGGGVGFMWCAHPLPYPLGLYVFNFFVS